MSITIMTAAMVLDRVALACEGCYVGDVM